MKDVYTLIIGGRLYPADSIEAASRKYCEARDRSGLGVSKMPAAFVLKNGSRFAKVSYNGKIWSGDETLLYAP